MQEKYTFTKNGVIANAISIGKIASHLVTIVLLMFQISIKACSKSYDLLVIKIFCYVIQNITMVGIKQITRCYYIVKASIN